MFKKKFLVIFSFLAIIFLVAGCGQTSSEVKEGKDPDTTENVELGTNEKSSETDSEKESSSANNESEGSGNKANKEDKGKVEARNDKGQSKELSQLKVHFIDVGQADSTLIEYSDGGEDYTILIDAGNWNRSDAVDYLQGQGISEIDLAIGTHPDADHIGQLDKVINSFDVGEVWLSGNTSTSRTFQRLLQAIDQHNVDYYEPRMGDEFEIGPLQIDVLYPRTISENDNEESISLKLTYGDVSFIFTGDAGRSDELKMLQSGFNLDADILQLGHHGSNTSTHSSFLETVRPALAVYSAGKGNSYGHPHKEVVNLVQSSGIKLYGTDVHGTIFVTTDGKDFNISTKKSGTVTPGSNSTSGNKEPAQPKNPDPKPEPGNNGCININKAALEELQQITHIGPARAEELIKLRPFDSVDDLSKIKGIGPARLADIKSQGKACVGG